MGCSHCGHWSPLCSDRLPFPCRCGLRRHPTARCPSSSQVKQCVQPCRPSSAHYGQHFKRLTRWVVVWLAEHWQPPSVCTGLDCCMASTILVRASILAVISLSGSSWHLFETAPCTLTSLFGSLLTWALLATDGFALVGGPSRRCLSFSSLMTLITCLRIASLVTLLSASKDFSSLRISLHRIS